VPGQIEIQPGDVLVLYSDGFCKATNAVGEKFGESRLEALLSESLRDSPETIRDSILAGVRAFSEG
jgi:phosphoserine phosphatase RsbU/P